MVKQQKGTPAEQYIQNAFVISLEDSLDELDQMYRSIWMALLQTSVSKNNTEEVIEWRKRLNVIELSPSEKFKGYGLYELCKIWRRGKDKTFIRLKENAADTGVKYKPAQFEKVLRQVMDDLSIICGEVSEKTGIEVSVPSEINTKGVRIRKRNSLNLQK